jgi:hypothetical protein
MSNVSYAKAAQGWQKKADICADCRHFKLDRIETRSRWGGAPVIEEKNLRCGLGAFKTGKTNTCACFSRTEAQS